jgi:hypothetical protein
MFAGVSADAAKDVNPTASPMAAVDNRRLKAFIVLNLSYLVFDKVRRA